MRSIIKLAAVVAIVSAGTEANSQAMATDGNRHLEDCRKQDYGLPDFVFGTMQTYALVSQAPGNERFHLCVPEGVKMSQIIDIYCKHLEDKPTERHLPASYLMFQAVDEAYPCDEM